MNNLSVKGSTQILSVIGDPIEHTLSPKIHNLLIQHLGHDNVYVAFHVYSYNVDKAIPGAYALGIKGMNVTSPHKQAVMEHLCEIDKFASQVGAVNTLKYTDKGYVGYNTDVYGLLRLLKEEDVKLKGKDILIIGAGGAARATAVMCASEGANKIYIANRTLSKAEDLAKIIKGFYDIEIQAIPLDEAKTIGTIDVCLQTTILGMTPKTDAVPIEDDSFYENIKTAVDLIYHPEKTLFLQKAESKGAKIINGFGMLFYQAVKAYEIWHNIEIDNAILQKVRKQVEESI